MKQSWILLCAQISLSFFLHACTSAQKSAEVPAGTPAPPEAVRAHVWTARLQIEDLATRKKNRVELEVLAAKPSLLRIDAKGTFGIVGGIGLLKNDQAKFILPRQKRAYIGRASPAALEPLLNITLDPRVLIPLFFDEPISGWNCTPDHCEQNGYTVSVFERDKDRRKARIEGPDFKALLVITNDGTKVLKNDSEFDLVVPEGYRIYKLP